MLLGSLGSLGSLREWKYEGQASAHQGSRKIRRSKSNNVRVPVREVCHIIQEASYSSMIFGGCFASLQVMFVLLVGREARWIVSTTLLAHREQRRYEHGASCFLKEAGPAAYA